MFTGIIESALEVESVAHNKGHLAFWLDLSMLDDAKSVGLGDSVAINGCCLTVAELDAQRAQFQAVPETLSKTNFGDLTNGDRVNIERAMRAGGRLDGHIVQGHVDQVGSVREIETDGDEVRITVDCGTEFAQGCILKGSVTVDGVSLTVAALGDDSFTVAVIPHTCEITTLGDFTVGRRVNLEGDVIGKYVRRYLETTR